MKEFDWIARYLAPLASHPGALGLKDDAALLAAPSGHELVLTQDAMTAGVHFFADDPPDLIARKLLRVNLSDLAAKGAKPLGYLLSLLLPAETADSFLAGFSGGLLEDQRIFGLSLLGGDTCRINGPLTLSLTAIGQVPQGKMIRRCGARPGDGLYVTGTLGDAALGLRVRQGLLPADDFLLERYLLPQPRQLPDINVTACLDISDGLAQDAGHLAAASGVKIVIDRQKLPLSKSALRLLNTVADFESCILDGGDDYELLFTAPLHQPVAGYTLIGHAAAGSGVLIRDESGIEIPLQQKGWSHF